jgi:hypothetical protein
MKSFNKKTILPAVQAMRMPIIPETPRRALKQINLDKNGSNSSFLI